MNIAIVDDHLMLAESLMSSIRKLIIDSDVKVFQKPTDFLKFDFSSWSPDVVISDILMPEMNGIDMFEEANKHFRGKAKFLFLSSLSDASTVKKALRAGAKGFVTKGASVEELILAIHTIAEDRQYICQSLKEDLLAHMLTDEKPMDSGLSPREKEVLRRICSGRTPKEIAFDMNLSLNTIQLYNNAILRKFKLNRTVDLVAFAIRNGLYEQDRNQHN